MTRLSFRRILLLAALAAVVPVSAFALEREAPAGISVSVSQGDCGLADNEITCELESSWTGVPGTEYYTLSVTRADGSVQDFGRVESGEEGGSASLWVTYVGAGTYSVTVSAYGTPPDEDEDGSGSEDPELLDRDSSPVDDPDEGGESEVRRSGSSESEEDTTPSEEAESGEATSEGEGDVPGGEPADPAPEGEGDTAVTLPECEPVEPAPEPEGPEPAGEPQSADAASAEPAVEASAEGEAPAPVELRECLEPESDSRGPCCPPAA